MKSRLMTGFVGAMCFLALPTLPAAGQTTYYVDDGSTCSGACDGTSTNCGDGFGNDACKYLQDALADATSGDEIWVAEGTYYPDEGSGITDDDRTETFTLVDGVDVYGGFATGDTSVAGRAFRCWDGSGTHGSTACTSNADCTSSERCLPLKESILSGDIGTGGTHTDNSYHVVTYNDPGADVTFDGFVVERGQADGSGGAYIDNQGGGITIRATKKCSTTIAISCLDDGDCPGEETCGTISVPSTQGLCIDTDLAALSIANSVFRNNHASAHGALNDHGSETSIDNCLFRDNTAVVQGAAMNVDNGDASITDCLFADNSATNSTAQGGAVWMQSRSATGCPSLPQTPTITDCVFDNNDAIEGGAIYSKNSSPTIDNSTFTDNHANGVEGQLLTGRGGAVYSTWTTTTGITLNIKNNCVFTGNTAMNAGGGVWLSGSVGTAIFKVSDSSFKNNSTRKCPDPCTNPRTGFSSGYGDCQCSDSFCLCDEVDSILGGGGGAIWAVQSQIEMERCVFEQNLANGTVDLGGALYNNQGTGTNFVHDCIFEGNLARGGAGVNYYSGGTYEYTNCLFASNEARPNGSAVFYAAAADTTVTNCTFANNTASVDDRAVLVTFGTNFTVVNSIFWNNSPVDIEMSPSAGEVCVTYSDFDETPGGNEFTASCTNNNINVDPDFTRDAEDCDGDGWGDVQCSGGACPAGSPDNCDDYGDLTLKSTSPCIDAGDNDEISGITSDLAGNDRFVEDPDTTDTGAPADSCPYVDMGAYEFQVADSCCDSGDCTAGEVCCSNMCKTGDCCDNGDCHRTTCCSNFCGGCE